MAIFACFAQLSFHRLWNLIFQFTTILELDRLTPTGLQSFRNRSRCCVPAPSESACLHQRFVRQRPFESPSIRGPGGDCLGHNHAGKG
jgi:hypothetical protein